MGLLDTIRSLKNDPYSVVKGPVEDILRGAATSLGGENLRPIEDIFRPYKEKLEETFLGKEITKAAIDALTAYKTTVKSYPNEMTGYVNISKKYIHDTLDLLKKYKEKLKTFKDTGSTLKKLESSKKEMFKIVGFLQAETKKLKEQECTAASLEKSLSKSERVTITSYLIGDFANDFDKILTYTLASFNDAINLTDHPAIDYDKLQIEKIKQRYGKKEIKRQELIQGNVISKYKKDAETAKKKVENDFKEAKKIHDKIKAVYKKLDEARVKIAGEHDANVTVNNEAILEDIGWKLTIFKNNHLVPICRLTGFICCKFKVGEKISKQELEKINESDGGILVLENQVKEYIMGRKYSQVTKTVPEAQKKPAGIEMVVKADEKLKKIKGLEKGSIKLSKEIQKLIEKAKKPD